jgi:alkylation response protein AidB-like acyl-CoA dehydrogenase
LALSDEQHQLIDLADRLASEVAGGDADAGWQALVDAGLIGLRMPDDAGRPSASVFDLMLVAERLASHGCDVPFVGQAVLAPELLRLGGAPPDLQTVVAEGTTRAAVCVGADLLFPSSPGPDDGPVLAWDSSGAHRGLVFGPAGLATVELAAAVDGADRTRALRPVAPGTARPLESRAVEPFERDRWVALFLTMLAADLVGAMEGAVALAVDHVSSREQFGRPVGSFQAVQHLLADATVSVEASRSATWHAAWAVDDADPAEALEAARTAKAYAAGVGRGVTEAVIQALGGVGMTWENPAHLFLRRALLSAAALGGPEAQLDAIGESRLGGGAPGAVGARPTGSTPPDASGAMDYRDSVEEAAFRTALRSWLATHGRRAPAGATDVERATLLGEWHRDLYRGGWMGLSWPVETGGRGLAPIYEAILNEEVGSAGVLPLPHVAYLGRAIMLFGDERQRSGLLQRLLSGEDVWCQGFSEPDAGSDLASLRTRATRRPAGGWVIDGQKMWTSDAPWADLCLVLARTDPQASKHAGISAFVVPMSAPGVEVRPITLSNGDREFSEVFFDQVVVDDDAMIGRPGDGWPLAMSTVSFERGPADIGFSSRYTALRTELEADARASGRSTDPETRRVVARAFVITEVLRLHVLRSLSGRIDGTAPGPEGSIDKLLATQTEQELHHIAMGLRGVGPLVGNDPVALREYLYSRAQSIAGGTSQIQRTIVAERVLGLPRVR